MPLARIITPIPEYSTGLAQDLRSLGFEVQTCAPGQPARDSADLEITVGQCDPDDAAKLISDISRKQDMCVLVGPQPASGKIRSIEMFVVKPKRQPVQGTITPAQVIEISTALLRSRKGKVVESAETPASRRVDWDTIRARAQAAKKSLSAMTQAWLRQARTKGHALGGIVEESWQAVAGLFSEVGQETARLGRRSARLLQRAGTVLSKPRGQHQRRQNQGDDSDLVPSLFNLFPQPEQRETESEAPGDESDAESDAESHIVHLKRILLRKVTAPDPRFLRAAAPAALVAVTILMGILMTQRRPPLPPDAMRASPPYEKPRVRFEHAVSRTDLTSRASDARVGGVPASQVHPAALIASPTAESRRKAPAHAVSGREESSTDEVVVRHLSRDPGKSASKPRHEIRRYSDLD